MVHLVDCARVHTNFHSGPVHMCTHFYSGAGLLGAYNALLRLNLDKFSGEFLILFYVSAFKRAGKSDNSKFYLHLFTYKS